MSMYDARKLAAEYQALAEAGPAHSKWCDPVSYRDCECGVVVGFLEDLVEIAEQLAKAVLDTPPEPVRGARTTSPAALKTIRGLSQHSRKVTLGKGNDATKAK